VPGGTAAGVSVEQLSGVSGAARAASGVAAGLPTGRQVERVLGEMGIPQDSAAGRQQFERVMEERRAQDDPEEYGRIRRGWCWGEEAFRKELLAQVEERRGASHYGAELQGKRHGESGAVGAGGAGEAGLVRGGPAHAQEGRAGESDTGDEAAGRDDHDVAVNCRPVQMGTGASLSNLLSAQRRGKP